MNRATYYVVTYAWAPGTLDQLRAIYPEHRAHIDKLGEQGGLWLTGTLGDGHAMAIFRDEATALTFAGNDPYVRSGPVTMDKPRPWSPIQYPGTSPGAPSGDPALELAQWPGSASRSSSPNRTEQASSGGSS